MGAEEPRWYYVGNGQLRLKEGESWTAEYQTIESRRAAVPSQVLGAEPVPQEPLPRAGSGGRSLLWLRGLRGLGPRRRNRCGSGQRVAESQRTQGRPCRHPSLRQ